MKYEMVNNIDKGYFQITKANSTGGSRVRVTNNIDYYLDKFNIDLNDYWILKKSGNFRLLDIGNIERYSGIMCFKKDTFNKEHIDKWLYFLYKDLKVSIPYLNNPFPPVEILSKIKIIGKE